MTDGGELLSLAAAAPLAGVTAGQLGRAARAGKLPGAVRDGGRWKVTEAGARSYATGGPGPGRPAVAGLEVEPAGSQWRARIGGGEWSVSDTSAKAVRAAHAADRKRRLIEAQRRELARWHGVPRRPTVGTAGGLAAGRRVVIRRRGRELRAVVLEVTDSGQVTAGWLAAGRVRVTRVPATEVREEPTRLR